jgi:L-fuculose-phosphate aldolase
LIIQGVRYASDFEAKKLMIETGQNLDEKGYTLSCDGSMSVRVGPNAVWITKQDSENGSLSQSDFVRVDLNGKSMNHSPDAVLPEDLEAHLKIYRENPKIQAVIHAYPVCAVVLQKDGRGLEACSYTPSVRALGKVTMIPSGDMAQIGAAAALAARSDHGVLLENDGCLMWGACIREAYRNIRLLDYCAQVRSRMDGCREEGQACPGQVQNAAVQPAAQSASEAGPIPGLTGMYHPAGMTQSKAVMQPVIQMEEAGPVPGLTGLYHPAGGTQNRSLPSGAPAEQEAQVRTQEQLLTAAPDPVKESAMAQVIRKSMTKMGKGGL